MKPNIPSFALALLGVFLLPERAISAPRVSTVWEVKSGGGSVFIAGSMPLLREEDAGLPPQYKQAYEASERVVFEVDPEQAKDEETAQDVIRFGMFTDGTTIDEVISEETYEKLGDFLNETGGPRAGMDQFRPWFAAIMISMTEMVKFGMRPDLGVGEAIQGWAVEDEKPIAGLEGMMAELKLLEGLPEEAKDHMLKVTLEDISDSEAMERDYEAFIKAWRAGDVKGLEKLEADRDTEMDEFLNKKLLRDRAAKWVKKIDKALEEGDRAMFVLGLGHLVGKGNLVEVLESKGYKVEQLKAKPEKKPKKKKGEKEAEKPAVIPVAANLAT